MMLTATPRVPKFDDDLDTVLMDFLRIKFKDKPEYLDKATSE